MYKINEIFYSLQGEGYHTGTASVFVRFSGCNLKCSFCDTHHEDGQMMTLEQIIESIGHYPTARLVVLTGGEPSLWIDDDFVQTLKTATGKCIAIETNGTHPLPQNIDWVTLSPKTAFDGGNAMPCIIDECDELKIVYTGQDLNQYDYIKAKHRFLQPCYCDDDELRRANMEMTVTAVLANPKWRLSLQTQCILEIK